MREYTNMQEIYRDADRISDGASNPVAVAGALHAMLLYLSRQGLSTRQLEEHPAITVTLDHLNCLVFGANHPEALSSDYREVMDRAKGE